MATTPNQTSSFRYLDLPPELQKIVLEKYFEDYTFTLKEKVIDYCSYIIIRSTVTSNYSIIDPLLVIRGFQKDALAAMSSCGKGSYKIEFLGMSQYFSYDVHTPGNLAYVHWNTEEQLRQAISGKRLLMNQTITTAHLETCDCWPLAAILAVQKSESSQLQHRRTVLLSQDLRVSQKISSC